MSVDWLFLIPVPATLLRSDTYLDVDDAMQGKDYIIAIGDRWNPRVEGSHKLRKTMAIELTRAHLEALSRSKAPREIVAIADAAAPNERGATYASARRRWLAAGAILLPD